MERKPEYPEKTPVDELQCGTEFQSFDLAQNEGGSKVGGVSQLSGLWTEVKEDNDKNINNNNSNNSNIYCN